MKQKERHGNAAVSTTLDASSVVVHRNKTVKDLPSCSEAAGQQHPKLEKTTMVTWQVLPTKSSQDSDTWLRSMVMVSPP